MTGEGKTEGAELVVIRLTRVGKKKQAHYRIVVADSRKAVQAKFISILGWYNPHTKELQVKQDELKAWFDKGAKPSNTLAKLLKKEGVKLPKWVEITEKKKAPKKKEAEAPTSGGAGVPTDSVGKEKPEEGAEVQAEESTEVAEAAEESTEAPEEEAKEEKTDPEAVEEKPETEEKDNS